MENQLQIIVKESGLEQTKAQVLLKNFSNYFDIAAEWENKSKVLVVTNETQKAEMKMAREGRLFLKEKRVAIEKTRKELKEQSLREGQTIDSIAKILKNLIEPIEEHLEKQEKFIEIKELERKEARKLERIEVLRELNYDSQFSDLLNMDDSTFNLLVAGIKKEIKDKIDAEKKAEEDRIAQEKAEKEEREKVRLENEKLKKEIEEKQILRNARSAELRPYIIFIRDYNWMIDLPEKEYKKEFTDIQTAAKLQYEYDAKMKLEEEAKIKLEKEKAAKELSVAKENQLKLEKELKEKQDAEFKLQQEKDKAEQEMKLRNENAAKATIKVKLSTWIDDLYMPEMGDNETALDIRSKFAGFKNWAKGQINNMK